MSGPEDIRESGSRIGSEAVRHREGHRCKELKRGEVAGHHRGLVSWRDDEPMRVQEWRGQGSVLASGRDKV